MARIWTRPISCEILQGLHDGTAVQHLGIEFT
jgi:1,4-dihydroxy-2-naphthoyl-CoA hydrolase